MKNKVIAFAAVLVGFVSFAAPVKSMVAAKNVSATVGDEFPENPTAKDYIQEGLIAMWDGIENAGYGEHDDAARRWVDLSPNGYDLVTYNGNPITEVGDSYFDLSCTKVIYMRNPTAVKNAVTIEAIFMPFESQSANIIGLMAEYRAPTITLRSANEGLMIPLDYSGTSSKGIEVNVDEVNAVAVINTWGRTARGYRNGIAFEKSYTSSDNIGWSYNYTSYLALGYLSTGWSALPYVGRVYAIRVYNRALTGKEIRYNYLIDKMRFGL
jgi:hypothetical protein